MRCPACEHENRDRARFCEACGATLSLSCAVCDRELRTGARFCDGCGSPVGTPGSAEPARDPRVYTPKHLADRILASKSAIEGERKQVSVLFADLQRSMELAEGIDPEDWHRIMDRFFAVLAEGVHRFEGTINQFTGDGIMALFGAPLAHEDHAQRACFAALHLTEELRGWADELRLERGLNLSVRMGLNSGEVVVGKIGDDLRMDYTAQGPTVGLAARMEQIAAPGTVYLTGSTAELVGGYFELRDLGESRVKGVAEPVHVYVLEGTGTMRTRLDISRSRGFFGFVGRELEMTTLEGALSRAADGNGQVVGIVGEAGVGKSRLCAEFVEKARAQGLQVLEAHCPSYGRAIPFLPVLELLRSYFGIIDKDPDAIARQKIAGTLLLLDPGFAELLPILFDFLSVPDPEHPSPQMSPEARQRQLQSFVRRLVQDESSSAPSVILIDDLHWIDPGSDAFLAELAAAARDTNTLLVANFRPEYSADWMQQSHYQQIPLAPLAPGAIDELLGCLLGDDPSVKELPGLIRERTGGNPFFIEEVVSSLLQSGSLLGAKGAYRLESPVTDLEIPATVQALLAARIDRLAERDKQVLQTAAVIGKRFRERVLTELIELPDEELAGALSKLRQAELLHEEALYPEVIYAFRHPLTHEVAYGSQLSERRREKHAAAARAIEELYAERLDEQAALIAHHREQAGEPLEAARWHARAAQWSGKSDPVEAVRHWQKAYDLLDPLPEGDAADHLRLLACVQLFGLGGWRLGMSEETEAALCEEARSLAERLDDRPMLVLLLGAFATRRGNLGDMAGMLRLALEAAELAKGLNNREVDGVVTLTLVYSAFCSGRLRESGRYIEEGIERFGEDLSVGMNQVGFSIPIFLHVFRCSVLAMSGQLEEAARHRSFALSLAREHSPENLIWALTGVVFQAQAEGNASVAEPAALEALELAEKHGSSFNIAVALNVLAIVRFAMRRWDEALALVDRQLELTRTSRTGGETEAADLALKAEILLGAGQPDAAEETAREAVAIAEECETLGWGIQARIALARILLERRGEAGRTEIEALLERATEAVHETGMRVQTVPIAETRARLAGIVGNSDACREGLEEALRLSREIGAFEHVQRLEAELEG